MAAAACVFGALACEKNADTTGQTTTTSADKVGEKVGNAADRATTAATNELHKEWNNLDVKVGTQTDPGVKSETPAFSKDAGISIKPVK